MTKKKKRWEKNLMSIFVPSQMSSRLKVSHISIVPGCRSEAGAQGPQSPCRTSGQGHEEILTPPVSLYK